MSTDDAQVDCHITAVAPQVPGYVVNLYFNDNTPVKEGDLLLPDRSQNSIRRRSNQTKAALGVAEARPIPPKSNRPDRDTTTNSTSGATAQKDSDAADDASSQAQLEQSATANLQLAQANVAAKLPPTNARRVTSRATLHCCPPVTFPNFNIDAVDAEARVAKSELDAAQQQWSAAQQAVQIARANAKSAQARLSRSQSQFLETKARERQIPITEAVYKSALASVERAKAALQQAELNLGYTRITAPITGQVTQRSVDLGQDVSPASSYSPSFRSRRCTSQRISRKPKWHSVRPGQKVRHSRGYVPSGVRGRCRFHRWRYRLTAGFASATKRHGEFHQKRSNAFR